MGTISWPRFQSFEKIQRKGNKPAPGDFWWRFLSYAAHIEGWAVLRTQRALTGAGRCKGEGTEPLAVGGAAFPPSLGNYLEVQPGGSHDLSRHFGDGPRRAGPSRLALEVSSESAVSDPQG